VLFFCCSLPTTCANRAFRFLFALIDLLRKFPSHSFLPFLCLAFADKFYTTVSFTSWAFPKSSNPFDSLQFIEATPPLPVVQYSSSFSLARGAWFESSQPAHNVPTCLRCFFNTALFPPPGVEADFSRDIRVSPFPALVETTKVSFPHHAFLLFRQSLPLFRQAHLVDLAASVRGSLQSRHDD